MPLPAQPSPTGSPSHGQKSSRKILPRIHVVDLLRPSRRLPPLLSEQSNGQQQNSPTKSSRGFVEVHNSESCSRKSTRSYLQSVRTLVGNTTMSSDNIVVRGQPVGSGKLTNGNGQSELSFPSGRFSSDGLTSDLDAAVVTSYLKKNEQFLDDFIHKNVSRSTIEGWLADKQSITSDVCRQEVNNCHSAGSIPGSVASGSAASSAEKIGEFDSPNSKENATMSWKKLFTDASRRRLLQDITQNVTQASSVGQVLEQLATRVAAAADADGFSVYTVDTATQEVHLHSTSMVEAVTRREGEASVTNLSSVVARNKQIIRINAQQKDSRSPVTNEREDKTYHVLCGPMLDSRDQVVGVTELYREASRLPFNDQDEQVSSSLLLLSDLLLKCHELYDDTVKQRKLNEFLLMVTKSIFQDIVSMDTVILKIMNYAKKLVNADRTALFLLDRHRNEIYSRVFDVGNESKGTGEETNAQPKEIRFSTSKGVAGYVAATGETLNIQDAYQDERFNREIDRQTGYTTKTILCMPICIRKKIIGVVQMVNKLHGVFTKQDEESFEMFAVYCGLALHQAKLYEKIRRSEQKNKVALEVLSYHSQACEEEVLRLKSTPVPETMSELLDFNFSPWSIPCDDKPLYVLYMFQNMFAPARFDVDCLCRFTLTVRKNYRNVPYHNWSHAFSVAQSMFTITQRSSVQLNHLERLALFVACLCHDVDHRGYTNQFMITSSSPIASLYSTSTMEHHHFNQTITILQHEGHNIFRYMSSEEYKQLLSDIKHFIISTDLAVFFQNKGRLRPILEKQSFDWNNAEHRMLGFSVAMTACDLCASSKPWDIQMETVQVIFEEFYAQGDKEKLQGKTPIPMMDRDKADQLPSSQVGFLVGICVPCYELLADIVPEATPMLDGTRSNLTIWQNKAEDVKRNEELAKESGNIDTKTLAAYD